MSCEMIDDDDGRRGEAVLNRALALSQSAYVPIEILFLMTRVVKDFSEEWNIASPEAAVVAAYLLGRCNGDIDELEKLRGIPSCKDDRNGVE